MVIYFLDLHPCPSFLVEICWATSMMSTWLFVPGQPNVHPSGLSQLPLVLGIGMAVIRQGRALPRIVDTCRNSVYIFEAMGCAGVRMSL